MSSRWIAAGDHAKLQYCRTSCECPALGPERPFYLGELVSFYGKFKINCLQVCGWKHKSVCKRCLPADVSIIWSSTVQNLFLCNLKVELRTGSVYCIVGVYLVMDACKNLENMGEVKA